MFLFHVSQDIVFGCDTFDSMVVAAESPSDAILIHPHPFIHHAEAGFWMQLIGDKYERANYVGWLDFSDISSCKVVLLGTADNSLKRGVICASFNAG